MAITIFSYGNRHSELVLSKICSLWVVELKEEMKWEFSS